MPIPGSCVGVTAPLPVKACCRNFHLNKQAHKLNKRILGSVVNLITRIFRKISVKVCKCDKIQKKIIKIPICKKSPICGTRSRNIIQIRLGCQKFVCPDWMCQVTEWVELEWNWVVIILFLCLAKNLNSSHRRKNRVKTACAIKPATEELADVV